MAEKVERKAPAARKPVADDLAVLHPDREITIAGRPLVVREYGFVEGLRLRAVSEPFLAALYAAAKDDGQIPGFVGIEAVLADHAECVVQLVAASARVESEWIMGLSDEDGYRLMQEWWLATGPFFIRRLVQRLAIDQAKAARPGGPASMTPSSAPDTAAQPISDVSPPAK